MVTDFIHPEVGFMVHGFGRKIPWQTRGYNRGLGDYRFETGLLHVVRSGRWRQCVARMYGQRQEIIITVGESEEEIDEQVFSVPGQ
jgi:hypothetical protein